MQRYASLSNYVSTTYLTTNYNTKTAANALFLPFAGGRISGNTVPTIINTINCQTTFTSSRISTGIVEIVLVTSYGSSSYCVIATAIQAASQIVVTWQSVDASTIRFHTKDLSNTYQNYAFNFVIF
jgi:hypothetical protein